MYNHFYDIFKESDDFKRGSSYIFFPGNLISLYTVLVNDG